MKAVCFDIEAADNEEILELSVYDFGSGEEIFHRYFRPQRISEWPKSEQVHHITPDMVAQCAPFAKSRREVQSIIDGADRLIGFAINNDTNYLRMAGIKIPDEKLIIEVQHWYWLCHGKENGVEFNSVPKLTVCADELGLDFPEGDAHSASNDTHNTLLLFNTLLRQFRESNGLGEDVPHEKAVQLFDRLYEEEQKRYDRENARGFIVLTKKPEGYFIDNKRNQPQRGMFIEVEGRFAAEHDIRSKFSNRQDRTKAGLYHLKDKDLEFFRKYSNVYDAEKEKFYRRLFSQRRFGHTVLNFRLT